ncbi:MAG: hypothetical protein IKH89_06865 [Bacteroidales bacterium]|nr:hypothetical protein [Bacteroidales bacterium]
MIDIDIYDYNRSFKDILSSLWKSLKNNEETSYTCKRIINAVEKEVVRERLSIPVFLCKHFSKYVDRQGHPLRSAKGLYYRKQLTITTANGILSDAIRNYIDYTEGKFEQVVLDDGQIVESPTYKKVQAWKKIDVSQFDNVENLNVPYRWAKKVGNKDKHKCGKPFKCNCCGKVFSANEGWRIDCTDYCFCNKCMKDISSHSTPQPKQVKGRAIIYTPMGNKR